MTCLLWGSGGIVGEGVRTAFDERLLPYKKMENEFDCEQKPRFGSESSLKREVIDRINKFNSLVICCGLRDEDISQNFDKSNYLNLVKSLFLALGEDIHIFYISTARVFGENQPDKSRIALPDPDSLYGAMHLEVENLLSQTCQKVTIIRPQAVYNYRLNYQRRPFLIPNSFVKALTERKEIELRSAGTQVRNFVDSKDIGHLVMDCLEESVRGTLHCTGFVNDSVKAFKDNLERLFDIFDKRTTQRYQNAVELINRIGRGGSKNTFQNSSIVEPSQAPSNIYNSVLHDVIMRDNKDVRA